MKNLSFLMFIAVLLTSCGIGSSGDNKNQPDFRSYYWGDTLETVLKQEAPKEAKEYDNNGVLEVEFEDTFMGITTDLDNRTVARMVCYFKENKFVGGSYYLYALKDELNIEKHIADVKATFGEPIKQYFTEDNDADNYRWSNERSSVRALARDVGQYGRLEIHYYETQFYSEMFND
ncbi:MAG: hypothetical protein PHU27_01660 [Salinivirgaceae bacterium]|nr:hypothetical protein [Salinivirgaceae bacterium]MDD4746974.1 hypothetical protein [Salinivirgaceae bacterium]MDY0280528.1 hypothetical protein [Salinivirgaceae bacterium]